MAKQNRETRHSESGTASRGAAVQWSSCLLTALFTLLLFLAPIFPDIKLTRPKLLLLETGLYGLLFLWAAVTLSRTDIRVKKLPLFLPAFAYVACVTLFYLFSPDRPVALNEFKRSLLSFTAFLVAAQLAGSENQRFSALAGWLSGSFLVMLYGIAQHYGGFLMIQVPKMDRVMSTFGNPIFFAAHVLITLPVALGLFLASKRKSVRFLLLVFGAAGIFALYFAQTRAAYIGLGAALAVFFFLSPAPRRTKMALLGIGVFLAVIFAVLTRDIWGRQQAHALIWRDTLAMWSRSPWFGTGPGTFHIYFPTFASDELKRIWPQGQFIVNDAHNEYVQYLSETGIVGFGIFAWLLIAFFRNAVSTITRTTGRQRYVVSGLVASAAGILVQNFFSVDMRFIISAVYLFLVMGRVDSFSDETMQLPAVSPAARAAGFGALFIAGAFFFPRVLQPYLAQKKVAATPDFFDQRVLEPAKTIADLQELAAQYPAQALIYEKMAWVYAKEKRWNEAIANFEKAGELDPSAAGPFNNLGNIFFLLNDRARAINYWKRSLAISPDQLDSRLNLATAYYYQGQLKEASEEIKEVLRRDPGNEKAIVMLKQMTE